MNRLTNLAGLFTFTLSVQDCFCLEQFSIIQPYFEQNNPAFQQLKTDKTGYTAYTQTVKQLQESILKETDKTTTACTENLPYS